MVKKKYRRMNKKKITLCIETDLIHDKVEEITEYVRQYDIKLKQNRRLIKKVEDYILLSDEKKAVVLRHILFKGTYTLIIYLLISFGIKITPEIKQILDLIIDLI